MTIYKADSRAMRMARGHEMGIERHPAPHGAHRAVPGPWEDPHGG